MSRHDNIHIYIFQKYIVKSLSLYENYYNRIKNEQHLLYFVTFGNASVVITSSLRPLVVCVTYLHAQIRYVYIYIYIHIYTHTPSTTGVLWSEQAL